MTMVGKKKETDRNSRERALWLDHNDHSNNHLKQAETDSS